MKHVGIVIEIENGTVKDACPGMITLVRKSQVTFYALVADRMDDGIRNALNTYGVTDIVALNLPEEPAALNNVHLTAQRLAHAVRELALDGVLGLSSPWGKEVLPRLAAMLDAPLVMECMALDIENNIGTAARYSGKVAAKVRLTGDVVVFGVRPNAYKAEKAPGQAAVHSFQSCATQIPALPGPTPIACEKTSGDSTLKALADAAIIISGGRGMKNKDNFKLLFDCAAKLGAAVGASRVAVDEGWVPYAHQVGQTGEKVSPSVYIACGISGSVQHFAGMKTSQMIIAVNTDKNAAMMAGCDYSVEADLFDILPELVRQLDG